MASACGKARTRLVRRASNSEYLHIISHLKQQMQTWKIEGTPLPNLQIPTLQRAHRAMPDHIRPDARRARDDDILVDARALGPAGLRLHVVLFAVVFELDGAAQAPELREGLGAGGALVAGGPEGWGEGFGCQVCWSVRWIWRGFVIPVGAWTLFIGVEIGCCLYEAGWR